LFDAGGDRKYLNQGERTAFNEVLLRQEDVVQRTFCWTLLFTGCRISEALMMTWNRVDVNERAMVFETLKRRKKGEFRAVPIPEWLIVDLRKLKLKAGERIWTFSRTTAWRLIKCHMESAGISGARACPKGLMARICGCLHLSRNITYNS
jgi:integrase/recombinase XerD